MKFGPLVFLAAFFALSASWCGLVLTPQIQLGRAVQATNSVMKNDLYPQERPGLARQGLQVYRANGCAYCHSQQVQQDGTLVDVVLTDAGKDSNTLASAVNVALHADFNAVGLVAGLPKPLLRNTNMEEAASLTAVIKNAGGKSEMHLVPTGIDIERGWGKRRTVSQDFLFDSPVMPGSQRVGPDLANVGLRMPDVNWQLMHLYAPRSQVKDSPMPRYQFLFEKRKIGREPSLDALQNLPKEFAPADGYEIVPKPEAKALVAYLMSLRSDTPLYEAPLTPPPAKPAATNAPATNALAK
jgi:cbb3-type cytochrome oxidase cytochrome c subunit